MGSSRVMRRFVSGVCVLALAACSGGSSSGGGGGGTGDLNGNWQFFMNVTGDEIGPYPIFLMQNGTVIDGANIQGTINGDSFQVTYPGFLGYDLVLSGTTGTGNPTGTVSVTGLPFTGTFRMVPFSPNGSMTVSGTVMGQPANISGTTAVGAREYDDLAKTNLTQVEVSFGDGSIFLELAFTPTGLGVGTFNVGTQVQVEVGYVTDAAQNDVSATGGTITVSRYDGTGMAGTFSITMLGGDSITGSFDVAWDVDAYEP